MSDTVPAVTAEGTSAMLAALAGFTEAQAAVNTATDNRLGQHGRTLAGHDASITAHTGQIGELRTDVDGVSASLAALAGVTSQRLDDHDVNFAHVETALRRHDGRLGTLEGQFTDGVNWIIVAIIGAGTFVGMLLVNAMVIWGLNFDPFIVRAGRGSQRVTQEWAIDNNGWAALSHCISWAILWSVVAMVIAIVVMSITSARRHNETQSVPPAQVVNQTAPVPQVITPPATPTPALVAPNPPPPTIDLPAPQPVRVDT